LLFLREQNGSDESALQLYFILLKVNTFVGNVVLSLDRFFPLKAGLHLNFEDTFGGEGGRQAKARFVAGGG